MKIFLCLLMGVTMVTVIEASWSNGQRRFHGFGWKTQHQQCLEVCQTNLELRAQLIKKICPVADPCFQVTCQNGGTCEEGVCSCTANFNGTFCENNLCDCVDCNGQGNCVAGICECLPGFIGEFCQTEDRCNDVMCNNGGTCLDGVCNCTAEFVGDRCDMPCNTVQGPCSIRQFMVVRDDNFNPVLTIDNIATIPECEDLCNANPDCLGFESDVLFSECLIFDVDISSVLINAASDGTSGVCTACG